jgi:hypothetical protein
MTRITMRIRQRSPARACVDRGVVDRQDGANAPAAARSWPGVDGAADRCDTLAHADDAEPVGRQRRRAPAVVADVDRQAVVVDAKVHLHRLRGTGVSADVGQRLLDQPVAGDRDALGDAEMSPSTET